MSPARENTIGLTVFLLFFLYMRCGFKKLGSKVFFFFCPFSFDIFIFNLKFYFVHVSRLDTRRWKRMSLKYNGEKKKWSIDYNLSIKKNNLSVSEFHLIKRVLLICFLTFILLKKVDQGLKIIFDRMNLCFFN